MKPFKNLHGVEAEKAEAMRRYNNRRSFRNLIRLAVVASLCYFWFPAVEISFQTVYRTGSVFIADRSVVFVIANLIVALIFLLSREKSSSSSSSDTEQDLYDLYTSALIVTASDEKVVECGDDDSNKQIGPAFIAEVEEVVTTKKEICRQLMESAKVVEYDEPNKEIVKVVDEDTQEAVTKTGMYRRTKSEAKKEIFRPVIEYRRTESAKVVAIERMNSEEFRLKVESFIMEKKRKLFQENDVVA